MTNLKSNSKKGRHNAVQCSLSNSQKRTFSLKTYLLLLVFFLFALNIGNTRTLINDKPLGFTCIEGALMVALDGNCSNTLMASMLVIGNTEGVDSSIITIDGQETSMITSCGDYVYNIDLFIGGEIVFSCTGNIKAEDRTAPSIICPDDTSQIDLLANTQTINGSIDGSESTVDIANYNCLSAVFNPSEGDHNYDVVTFTTSSSDVYTFALETEWNAGILALYQGDFNPDNSCQYIIGQNDDTNEQGNLFDPQHRLVIPLREHTTYSILITNINQESMGNWELVVATDGGDSFIENIVSQNIPIDVAVETVRVSTTLICDNIDHLRLMMPETYMVHSDGTVVEGTMSQNLIDKLLMTGFPSSITDNCSDILVTVSDEIVQNGDCGDAVLMRSFQVADQPACDDEPNVFSCTQAITFRKPMATDVVLPPPGVALDYNDDFPTDGAVGGVDDNPAASVTGYPWLPTAFGYEVLDDDYCTVGASYSDEPRINISEGVYRFRREWNIIDWCYPGDSFTWNVIVGETNYVEPMPMTVVCPPDTDEGLIMASFQTVNGVLNGAGASLDTRNYGCFIEMVNATEGDHEYDLLRFTVTDSDVYVISLAAAWGDGIIALYQGGFTSNDPCQNMIAAIDDTHATGHVLNPSGRLTVPLVVGQMYTLLVTNVDHESTGAWELTIATNGDSFVEGPGVSASASIPTAMTLVCNDLDSLQINEEETYLVHADGTLVEETMSPGLRDKLTITGFPVSITGNCDILVTVSDEIVHNGDCGEEILMRTFYAQEQADCGGEPVTFSCTQAITFRKAVIADVVLPSSRMFIDCDENFLLDENNNPHPSVTAYPQIRTAFGFYDLNNDYCNIGASYFDESRIDICTGTYKFRRKWSLLDWCNPDDSYTYDQIVKVGSNTGPVISWDLENNNGSDDLRFEISISPFSCTANWRLPYVNADANCDPDDDFDLSQRLVTILRNDPGHVGEFVWSGREITAGQATVVQGLEIGRYTATWCISDDCGNETCKTWELIITDEIAPTASCNSQMSISIGDGDSYNGIEGIARINAIDVNEASYDNCEIDHYEIRRNKIRRGDDFIWFTEDDEASSNANIFSPWGYDYINFYCFDVGEEITVELRAYDIYGNFNTCWFSITPQDQLIPYCYAPDEITMSCANVSSLPNLIDEYAVAPGAALDSLNSLFGMAYGTDNCAVDTIVELEPDFNINDCGWGTIIRRFEAWQWKAEGDVNGNGVLDREEAWISANDSRQTITITESHDYHLEFPADLETDCMESLDLGVQIEVNGCDVLAVNVGEPIAMETTGDECSKYAITYDVINWCLWDGEYAAYIIARETGALGGQVLNYDPTVDVTQRPILWGDDDGVTIDYTHPLPTRGDTDEPEGAEDIVCNGIGLENGDLCSGRWNYTQYIRVYDTTAPEVTVDEYGGVTEACSTLEPGQFGDVNGSGNTMVSIPFGVLNECELGLTILSATIDLFVVDENGDGEISTDEFTAETGAEGNAIENITANGGGHYLFEGHYPIIPSTMGDNIYHAVSLSFEDACGNTAREIIRFDVVDCNEPTPIFVNGDNNALNVMGNVKTSPIFNLLQNSPNPFMNETTISFNLRTDSEVTIILRDLMGRELQTIQGPYVAGLNKVVVTKTILQNVSGVVTYTIKVGDYTETRKMVVME